MAIAPFDKLVLIAMAILCLGGGNLVVYLHLRRVGRPWWHAFGGVPFRHLNLLEWIAFISVFLATLALGLLLVGRPEP
jgi:hypothetical protein